VDLRKKLQPFLQTRWFRILYLVVVGLILVALFPLVLGPAACLVLFLMPAVMFVIPYWFGERRGLNLLVNGVAMFAVASLVLAAVQAQGVLGIQSVELSSISIPGVDPVLSLSNGTVTPFHASPPANVTFRVRLSWQGNATPADFLVWTNLTAVVGLSPQTPRSIPMQAALPANGTANETWYSANVELDGSIFLFGFVATRMSQNWTFTPLEFGPITASGASFYVLFLYLAVQFLLLPLLIYFSILFMWWYTHRLRETRQRMYREREAKMSEAGALSEKPSPPLGFTCTNCGADVAADAVKCPKCGASFED